MSEAPTKVCTKCGGESPATREFFYTDRGKLTARCKECVKAQVREYAREHPEEKSAYNRAYREAHSEELSVYLKQWQQDNREYLLEHMRQYRLDHIEEERVYRRKRYREHPEIDKAKHSLRKARKNGNGGSHTAQDIRDQYQRQGGKCYYCGERLDGKYHADHVTPLALGGSNGPENIVCACGPCNLRKNAKHPIEFAGILL